jgi:hypothetical protein
METPDGCFYDVIENARVLLKECRLTVPPEQKEKEFVENGPNCLFLYHPALGPLYEVITQKIRGGSFKENSELQLEIAEADITELSLEGSLIIEAKDVMGKCDTDGVLQYGEQCGRCLLERVTIKNSGIDRQKNNIYWKNEIHRKESMSIHLEGNSEFIAKDLTFEGDLTICVADGERVTAYEEAGEVKFKKEPIVESKPLWRYGEDFQLTPRGC